MRSTFLINHEISWALAFVTGSGPTSKWRPLYSQPGNTSTKTILGVFLCFILLWEKCFVATSEKLMYVVEGCCMFVSQTDINGNKECKKQCLQLKKNKQETSNCFVV